MLEIRKTQDGASTPTIAVIASLAAVAIASVLLIIGSAGEPGRFDANASPGMPDQPPQAVSQEEHREFIRQSHDRVARELDPEPLPPTF